MPGTPVFLRVSCASCSNLGRAASTCSRVTPTLFVFTGCCCWHADKTTPMALKPSSPPVVAVRTLSAWRREVEVARALVNASNVVESISVRSFQVKLCQSAHQAAIPDAPRPLWHYYLLYSKRAKRRDDNPHCAVQ